MSARVITDLLRSDGFIIINKNLAGSIGLVNAAVYSEILSKYSYFEDRGMLTGDGYFFCTVEDLKESTSLTAHQQRTACEKLSELGLIDVQRRGVPGKRYIKVILDEEIIMQYLRKHVKSQLLKNLTTSDQKIEDLYNKNNNKNNHSEENERVKFEANSNPEDKSDQEKNYNVAQPGNVSSEQGADSKNGWKEKAEKEVSDLPSKYRKVTAALVRNGIKKDIAYRLAREHSNERARNVIWYVINQCRQKKSIKPNEMAGEIIKILDEKIDIPVRTREQKAKMKWLEWVDDNPEAAAAMFGVEGVEGNYLNEEKLGDNIGRIIDFVYG